MEKLKVGILTFSDGRDYIHQEMLETNRMYQDQMAKALEKTGLIEVYTGREIIGSPKSARTEGMYLKQSGVDLTICNYAIWCYPHLTAIATNFAPGPYLMFCNLHPSKCGMVGMMAASGTLDQLGRTYSKVWGDINDNEVLEKVLSFIKAAGALSRLKGQTMGVFGGRPLGMYTAVSNLDQWQQIFGIDVEHCEQYEIMRRADTIEQDKVTFAREFLEKNSNVLYDGKQLTPEIFEKQIRTYYALKEIIKEKDFDFIGIKSIGDLTDYWCTVDLAEAFLNDPYDWDGPKEPIVAATESDMDGALTMQIFKHLTNAEEAVLFADVRHFDWEKKVWFFSNSGTHATWFAGASKNPLDNLKNVTFKPECSDFPAGGASVHHFAVPGKVTLARMYRRNGNYRMAIVPGEIVQFEQDEMERLGEQVTPEWPIAFTKIDATPELFLSEFPCNHIHGVYGDYIEELVQICRIKGIEYQIFAKEPQND
ncbi:MAG: L-fucose/L-arabinose isomerase family protein [Spirochaetales bacterium]|nr:L-fucose/L-arabinose isomerase family protein [Spirochaetales bacterium]